ncbi:hypothetical protein LXL04_003229 [Taraxacum kok-saghyz]
MSSLVTVTLYHGREFTIFPKVKFIDGDISFIDMVGIDKFPVHQVDKLSKVWPILYYVIYYHYFEFEIPNGGFHFTLRALGNDEDVCNLEKFAR